MLVNRLIDRQFFSPLSEQDSIAKDSVGNERLCDLEYPTLICSGQVTREEALAEMEQDPYPREIAEADREYVIKKLGLTEESFDRIIAAPPKLHASYPSNKFFYHDLHALKQAFKRIATRV